MAEQVYLGHERPPSARRNMDGFKLHDGDDVFTPKKMLELPRPSPAIANEAGNLAYTVVSTYSFEEKKTQKTIHVVSLTGNSSTTIDGATAFWLDSNTLARVTDEEGVQHIEAIEVKFDGDIVSLSSPISVGSLPKGASADNFQYSLTGGKLVFSAPVYTDYDLHTIADQDKAYEERGTTAYVFDDTFVRHWDTWRGPKRSRLFTVDLKKSDGEWSLGCEFYRPLLNTHHYTPVEPFGGTDDFDITDSNILYTTKDPGVPEAAHTRQHVYIVPIDGSGQPKQLTSGNQGATHNPVLSPNGEKAAWLELAKDGYESDHSSIVVYDLKKGIRFFVCADWDRSPDAIRFSPDGNSLIFTAGDNGHIKVFTLPVPPTPSSEEVSHKGHPTPLTERHAATGAQLLPNGRVLFTASSFVSPNNAFVISGLDNQSPELKQITKFGADVIEGKGLDPGEEFWFTGAKHVQVHGFALKPKGWKEGQTKKYPAVLLIHGGPQGAWEDSWSTRWNPNLFAQQGYYTIMINPTGSTTYGQEFTDAITEDWGGRPFDDMIKGWKYILEKHPEIDPERTVAAGASWGGFAINWIQGHPEFGFGFKALACHDGVFDTHYNGFSTDELFFFNHDFGGPPWKTKVADKFNPSRFVSKWSTPQLVIHGGKDFRLAETEGIGAFHALQQRGVPSRFLYFPDENHWVLNAQNSQKWHYEVFKWFAEFVGERDQ